MDHPHIELLVRLYQAIRRISRSRPTLEDYAEAAYEVGLWLTLHRSRPRGQSAYSGSVKERQSGGLYVDLFFQGRLANFPEGLRLQIEQAQASLAGLRTVEGQREQLLVPLRETLRLQAVCRTTDPDPLVEQAFQQAHSEIVQALTALGMEPLSSLV